MVCGAFADPKVPVKAVICASFLPRPRFAYVPRLRCLFAPRHGPTLISKRDARHYSRSSGLDHSGNEGWRAHLAMTTGWQPFLALEQLPWDLTASAGFAQGLTAVINYNQSHDARDWQSSSKQKSTRHAARAGFHY
jgi:hypothetical protein